MLSEAPSIKCSGSVTFNEQALKALTLRTKKAVVEAALRLLVQVFARTGIRRLRGPVYWQGDGDE